MTDDQLISVIIPTFNEAENIEPVYQAVKKAFSKLTQQPEIIFVDDGSQDDSVNELHRVRHQDPKTVKVLELARNFGKEIALTAGLHEATGEAAIMLDADLQHPPELIPVFITRWEDGVDVVIGVRAATHTSGIKKMFSGLFYKLMRLISDTEIIPHATDYRMVDRQVIDAFIRFTERNRITRGLFDWLGFKRDVIFFTANARMKGEATYSFRKLLKLSINSFISHSLFPLKLAGYAGLFIVLTAGPLGLFIFIERWVLDDPFQFHFTSPAILAVINLFLVGVILCCLGLISMYIANIHQEVTNRPLYVLRRPRRRKKTDQ